MSFWGALFLILFAGAIFGAVPWIVIGGIVAAWCVFVVVAGFAAWSNDPLRGYKPSDPEAEDRRDKLIGWALAIVAIVVIAAAKGM